MSKREKRFLIAGGVAALAILTGVYVIEPSIAAQLRIQDEVREKEALLERFQLLASEKDRYRLRVEGLRARLRQAEGIHFTGQKLPLVAAEVQGLLHQLGQEAGVTIVRETVRPPKKVEMLTEVTVELSVQGDLRGIRDFLYKVQTAPRLLATPKLVIRGLPARGPTALSADLQVAGYVLGGERKGLARAPSSPDGESRPREERG